MAIQTNNSTGSGVLDNLTQNNQTGVTSADQTNPLPSLTFPVIPYHSGDISSAKAATDGLDTSTQLLIQQQKDAQALEAKRQSAPQETQAQGFFSRFTNAKEPSQARAEATATTGLDPVNYFAELQANTKEVNSLSKEYSDIKNKQDAEIEAARANDQSDPTFQDKMEIAITRKYAPKLAKLSSEINTKVAVMQLNSGNFQEAQKFIDKAVTDATSDSKYLYDSYTALHAANEEVFNRLDKKYSDAYDKAWQIATQAHKDDFELKKQLAEWIVKYPKSGVSLYDTLDSAAQKVAAVGGEPALNGTIGSPGFGSAKVESDIRRDAVDLLDQVDAGALTIDKAYEKLRKGYSPREVTDEALKNLLGITPPPPVQSGGFNTPDEGPLYVNNQSKLPGASKGGYKPITLLNGGDYQTTSLIDNISNFLFKQ